MNVIVPTRSTVRTRKHAPKQGVEAEPIDRLLETAEGKAPAPAAST
jgi:hypothetical protein